MYSMTSTDQCHMIYNQEQKERNQSNNNNNNQSIKQRRTNKYEIDLSKKTLVANRKIGAIFTYNRDIRIQTSSQHIINSPAFRRFLSSNLILLKNIMIRICWAPVCFFFHIQTFIVTLFDVLNSITAILY